MRFVLSAEQEEIRGVARQYFTRDLPLDKAVERVDSEVDDPRWWPSLAEELGCQALVIPEENGGLGASFVELAMVLEEAGRALSPSPLLSTAAVATAVLLRAEDSVAAERWLPGIADGSVVAAVAIAEASGSWTPAGVECLATQDALGWSLTGAKRFVLDAAAADVILVFGRAGDELALFAVEPGDGVVVEPRTSADPTRHLADLTFDRAPATLIGALGDGAGLLTHAVDVGCVAVALDAVGGARQCLEIAVEYAKTREQFGKPIGSFQAIKHKCADMLLRVEAATSVAYEAAAAVAADADDLSTTARIAKAYATESYGLVAAETIQILGGIGFTWEHPAHLFFARAKFDEHLFGGLSTQRHQLAEMLAIS
jgi:alkylation response protein AidB-like acyl-CoA dehydrogenase